MQTVLETEISSQEFAHLPPVQEIALSAEQKLELQPFFEREFRGIFFAKRTLCLRSKAITIGGFALGARVSRHSQSPLVSGEHLQSQTVRLTRIQFFVEYTAVTHDVQSYLIRQCFACVKWF